MKTPRWLQIGLLLLSATVATTNLPGCAPAQQEEETERRDAGYSDAKRRLDAYQNPSSSCGNYGDTCRYNSDCCENHCNTQTQRCTTAKSDCTANGNACYSNDQCCS